MGFPLHDVEFNGSNARHDYAGGPIIHTLNGPKGPGKTWSVDVRFVGFECVSESDADQLSDTDEPFFLIGVVGTQGSTAAKFGPYENVASGTRRYEASMIAGGSDGPFLSPPIVLGVTVMEHDYGNTDEAVELVRDVLKQVEGKVDQAAGAFMGASTGNHVMPEWLRDIVIGWVPEVGAAVLGLADDEVGKVPKVLFDYKPAGGEWEQPSEKGQFGENMYTDVLQIDGGSEGIYKVYFHVRIGENDFNDK